MFRGSGRAELPPVPFLLLQNDWLNMLLMMSGARILTKERTAVLAKDRKKRHRFQLVAELILLQSCRRQQIAVRDYRSRAKGMQGPLLNVRRIKD